METISLSTPNSKFPGRDFVLGIHPKRQILEYATRSRSFVRRRRHDVPSHEAREEKSRMCLSSTPAERSAREDERSPREDERSVEEDGRSLREDEHSRRRDERSPREDERSTKEDRLSGGEDEHSVREDERSPEEDERSREGLDAPRGKLGVPRAEFHGKHHGRSLSPPSESLCQVVEVFRDSELRELAASSQRPRDRIGSM